MWQFFIASGIRKDLYSHGHPWEFDWHGPSPYEQNNYNHLVLNDDPVVGTQDGEVSVEYAARDSIELADWEQYRDNGVGASDVQEALIDLDILLDATELLDHDLLNSYQQASQELARNGLIASQIAADVLF